MPDSAASLNETSENIAKSHILQTTRFFRAYNHFYVTGLQPKATKFSRRTQNMLPVAMVYEFTRVQDDILV